jgi:hypothetical protein
MARTRMAGRIMSELFGFAAYVALVAALIKMSRRLDARRRPLWARVALPPLRTMTLTYRDGSTFQYDAISGGKF